MIRPFSDAEIFFGLLCTNLVVLPRLYQQLCNLTPYNTTPNPHTLNGRTEVERERQQSQGRSKREWLQLEEKATRDQRLYGQRARLGDEEAIDIAVDEDGVRER